MPQYLRGSVVSASSEQGRHHLHSATNLNYILLRTRTKFGERAFSVSEPTAAFVRQIVANSNWLQMQPEVTFLNCAFNKF